MARILIVDDDPYMTEILTSIVDSLNHYAVSVFTLQDGFEMVLEDSFDVVFLDVILPDGNGLYAIPKIRSAPSSPEVIIITSHGDPEGAELAIRNGAWDYVTKTASVEQIKLHLIRALDYREEKARRGTFFLDHEGIIGDSPSMIEALERVSQAARNNSNILIYGETGTGKELIAKTIHKNSMRSHKRMVVVDCAVLPETLVESLLFGYERGAFTGADKSQEGLIEQAHEGTLFLDEVGELPLSIQKSFLRFIQERAFLPLGSKKEKKIDFRLMAATNCNIDEMVSHGRFRKDLLYRLRSQSITLPPLRDHVEDIAQLLSYYIERLCVLYDIPVKQPSDDFIEAMQMYEWPGNVRELINTLEQILFEVREEKTLSFHHLPAHIRMKHTQATLQNGNCDERFAIQQLRNGDHSNDIIGSFRDFRKRMELLYLRRLLSTAKGKRKDACRISGLSRTRLYELMVKHNLHEVK